MFTHPKRTARTILICSAITITALLFSLTQWHALSAGAAVPALGTQPNAILLAGWMNNQAAVNVIGQPNFNSNSPGTTASTQNQPSGVAVDPTTGKVFVADFSNNRVLRYSSAAAQSTGQAAEAVFGQPNFTANAAAITQSGMNGPTSVFVDGAGRLWVADYYNGRVLRFDSAATKANGANADGVLGQPNFTTYADVCTQSGMSSANGVFVDETGRLWVSDASHNRVLRFDNAVAKANGANADGVLGQPNFTSSVTSVSQSGMYDPRRIFVDAAGRLWVPEYRGNRVLRFDNAAAKPNGANADGVLGQPNFNANAIATTQSGMQNPLGVFGDPDGRLYVTDANNNRVLVFNNAATLANGANADNVLGQPDFFSSAVNNGGVSATSFYFPSQAFFDCASYSLYVTDFYNSRVVRYTIDAPPPLALGNYLNAGPIAVGGTTMVTPDAAPSNGSVASLTASAPGFTGTFSGDPATGVVTISNAAPAGTFTVTVTATDNCGAASTTTFTLTVNTPPSITAIANTRQPGAPATTSNIATVSDPDQSAGSLVVTFSDGTTSKIINGVTVSGLTNTNGTISASIGTVCTATAASFTLKVTDNLSATAMANLTVNVSANAAPVVKITGPASGSVYSLGTAVSFTGSFTDDSPGLYTAQWKYDSILQTGTVNANAVSATYPFLTAGVYLVSLAVTDACGTGTASTIGGLSAMVVIYDPNGGFVTGGGWITSPAGAYRPNLSLTGKASFGFVSKYKPGATTPTGNTEFQFQQAGFNFRSASYDWLVVAGARAQYKGVGTVNGSGNYGFLLTAIDGQITGGGGVDKFRIKIWNKNNGDAMVYDNQVSGDTSDAGTPNTALGGGSIIIHK